MGYQRGAEWAGGDTLSEINEALVAPIEDPYLRAQFTGFAALQERAA
jgi:hypothetical protein